MKEPLLEAKTPCGATKRKANKNNNAQAQNIAFIFIFFCSSFLCLLKSKIKEKCYKNLG